MTLEGPHHDLSRWKSTIRGWGYLDRDIHVLSDEDHVDPNGEHWPSSHNILRKMEQLTSGVQPFQRRLFVFCGHRTEEGLLGIDTENPISDLATEFRLFPSLPPKSVLTIIFDCCCAGNPFDLPFLVDQHKGQFRPADVHRIGRPAIRGKVVYVGACGRDQMATEVKVRGETVNSGPVTFYLASMLAKGGAFLPAFLRKINKRFEGQNQEAVVASSDPRHKLYLYP